MNLYMYWYLWAHVLFTCLSECFFLFKGVDILVSVVCVVQEAYTLFKSILHSLSLSVSADKPSISSASRNACNNIKYDVHGSGWVMFMSLVSTKINLNDWGVYEFIWVQIPAISQMTTGQIWCIWDANLCY